MTWGELRSGSDRVLSNADKTTAEQAIAELIWNALDAEASSVAITVDTNELGAATKVVVADDGHGIRYSDSPDLFLTEGDSWKKDKRFSPELRRPMHGQLGRGRLLTYAIADEVEWNTTALGDDGEFERHTVLGQRAKPAGFEIGDPSTTDGAHGTQVVLRLRDTQKAARVGDDGFVLKVLELMSESLTSLPDVLVTWRGERMDPSHLIERREPIELPPMDSSVLRGHEAPELVVVEWSSPQLGSQRLQLCDESGASVSEHRPSSLTPVPFSWTAYLKWTGFRDPDLMGIADLHSPEFKHDDLLTAAAQSLGAYLADRLQAERGHIVKEWIDEGVYPYRAEPDTLTETVERELFDIVAVIASSSVPKRGADQKRLTLNLLREALRTEPTRLRKVLEAVVHLDADDLENLERLLERTELGAIVRAAHKVADRLDFLDGLSTALYSDETRREFREIDQLHPMLVREAWVFGDEWDTCLSEHGLTRVVETVVTQHNPDAMVAIEPVTLPDGKKGRLDLFFHKIVPESEQTRHLVVELKRPGRLTMDHYGQLADYATAIVQHPEVLNTATKWDFWLVGTDLNATLSNERDAGSHRTGFVRDYGTHRLWVTTWGELIDSFDASSRPTELSSASYRQRQRASTISDELTPSTCPTP